MAVAGPCDTALLPIHWEAGWSSSLFQYQMVEDGFMQVRLTRTHATAVTGEQVLVTCQAVWKEKSEAAWPWP